MPVNVLVLILVSLPGVFTDYDAPLSEAGDPTPKYYKTRELLKTLAMKGAEPCLSNPCKYGTCINEDNGYSCAFCTKLSAPENGDINGSAEYNAVVTFTCNHGYQLKGESSLICEATGNWSGANPTCIGPSKPAVGRPYNKTALIATVVTVCAVALLGIVAAALMYYCRRKKAAKMDVLSKRTGTDNAALEMAPGDFNTINDNNTENADNDDNDAIVNADNNDIDNNDAVYDNVPADTSPLTDFTTPISRNQLEEVYNHRHSNQVFREEFQSISKEVSNPRDEHIRPENEKKNRFTNVFTWLQPPQEVHRRSR
uniref:Sushi domain-containing protein n=1 Tax=Branchiostoma floridae TaxID=7739 RepID=C3YQL3_BRAFL|eukprot:XP_002601357.1 hypothetical protein BRAFLDRAFT_82719 [Branchiostoma floridae]